MGWVMYNLMAESEEAYHISYEQCYMRHMLSPFLCDSNLMSVVLTCIHASLRLHNTSRLIAY